ncbi:MAG TPA: heavy metal translocating P-type ATPase [Gaiellaceae bacterium]
MAVERVVLPVRGMTCAGCVARVEGSLNGLDGVEATVNLATETASVRYDPGRVEVDDLVGAVANAGYSAVESRTGREVPDRLGARLVAAAALTLPVALVAMIPSLRFDRWEWVALALSTPVVFWAGLGFHRAALAAARHGVATMDTLVSIGTLAAWTWSAVVLLADANAHTYFEVAAVITTLVLLGRIVERRARRRSGEAIRSLLELGAKDARVLRGDVEVSVPVERLRPGDRVVVRPGERIPADGVVEEGISAIDRSLFTGEPLPEEAGPGSEVAGATLNLDGRLVVRTTRVGSDTAVAQIARLVEEAQSGKAPVERLADRVSAVFVPVVVVLALATLAGWLLAGGSAAEAFTAAIAVLIVACPCALGLATPTAVMVGTGRGAQLGIVIRGPEVLERTRRADTIVLDKTGTVTEGRMRLANGLPDDVLRLAGAVESASEHPAARAVADAARERFGSLPRVGEFRAQAGLGVTGVVEGRRVEIGRDGVRVDGVLAGRLELTDAVKPTSAEAVRELRALGLDPVLLTGDRASSAHAVAREVGVERVLAEVDPAGKAAEIRRLQEGGAVVAMVGDGVNDAPALASADLGVALGTGADVAVEASDLTLVSGDLRAAVDAIRLARRTLRTIQGNLVWAFAYNVAAVPLAAAGLLNPMIAAATMAFSSLFVVTNSLRLRGFRSIREDA